MTELRLVQVDAFADRPFTGNPAAVMPLTDWLPDETMQAIAMENNLAETAFTVAAEGDSDYELRWFTPTVEVDLCGHATLASGHVLMGDKERLRFRTRKSGILEVARNGDVLSLDLPPIPVLPGEHPELIRALRVDSAEVYVSSDRSQATAIVLLPDAEAVRGCAPDFGALSGIPMMAIATAPGDNAIDVISRVFVSAWGIDEDPVTGSAHAALTPFWSERLGRSRFTAFQASRRGGRLDCRVEEGRVILDGRCITVLEGTMRF